MLPPKVRSLGEIEWLPLVLSGEIHWLPQMVLWFERLLLVLSGCQLGR